MFGIKGMKHRNNVNLRVHELKEFFAEPDCKEDPELYQKNLNEYRDLTTRPVPCPQD